MKPRSYTSDGIILAKINYGETDRIFVVYSKEYGKLSLIAKGVRKPKSKKGGSLEVFNQIKFAAAKGKGLDIITEVETLNNYTFLKKDLKKASLAYYFVEIVGRMTKEGEPHPELFLYLLKSLESLIKDGNLRNLKEEFVYNILVILGFWPKGKKLVNPEQFLEDVLERKINSARVGKRVLS